MEMKTTTPACEEDRGGRKEEGREGGKSETRGR